MDEASAGIEPLKRTISLEVKSLKEITPEDESTIEKFAKDEKDIFFKTKRDDPRRNELGSALIIHLLARASINDARVMGKDLSLVMAKDPNGQLLGYSMVTLDLANQDPYERATYVYIGVRSDQKRRGIATELMNKRLEVLKGLGIKAYKSDSRNEIMGIYDKLGVKYTAESLPADHLNRDSAKRLTVQVG